MSDDPHDQLLLQIRGAVAEYERTLITERMRRGRQARLRAGTLLPWTRPPFGYRLDPDRPRDAAAVRTEPARRCWSRSYSTGISSRGPPCISSRRGWPAGGGHPDGQAALDGGQRARHLAQPGLCRPGADQPHPARASQPAQVGAAAGRPGGKPRPAPGTGLDRGAGPADRLARRSSPRSRPSWIPTSKARRGTPGTSTCCARWSAAARAGWRAPAASSTPATATTCAAGAPTRCARPKGDAAPPATSPPGSLMTWSGPTCARC